MSARLAVVTFSFTRPAATGHRRTGPSSPPCSVAVRSVAARLLAVISSCRAQVITLPILATLPCPRAACRLLAWCHPQGSSIIFIDSRRRAARCGTTSAVRRPVGALVWRLWRSMEVAWQVPVRRLRPTRISLTPFSPSHAMHRAHTHTFCYLALA